jgi:Replication-relaxation
MTNIQQLEKQKGVHGTELISKGSIRSKTAKRIKDYDSGDVRHFTEQNAAVDYKILLALYEHRALTPAQIKKICFPDLHENSIRNRTKTLADRKVLTVHEKSGLKTRPIKLYSLSALGLRILTENILQVMEYTPQFDDQKEHFTIDDLKVRSQHIHHYELQDWILDILEKRPQIFHCEWRRFPFIEGYGETVRVKPDWVFLDVNEEVKQITQEDVANNPLLYPYLYRQQIFQDVTFTPTLCVECDRGTMNRSELVEKWEGYRSLPNHHIPKAITIFYKPRNIRDMRHRLIRETLTYSFELEASRDEIQLFQGDHQLSQEIVNKYFERDMNLLHNEPMANKKELFDLMKAYCSQETGEAALLDVERAVEHFKIPAKPDAIIGKQGQNTASLQFIFYCIPGWVNPFIKIHTIKRFLSTGHLSRFNNIKLILLYPDNKYLNDIKPIADDIYYVSFQEIKEEGKWGIAHRELRKHRQVKWINVQL